MSRAVHIDGIEYPYKVGITTVTIETPNGKIYPSWLDILNIEGDNWTWNEIERAFWKPWPQPMITPKLIKLYLEKVLSRKENPDV